uniref:Glycoside hydrolase 35 catalytic domain-containing protein n=1 Tax=Acrobeloides nanus TaxID=290746 RepID=A0A914E7W9_9BILA
MLSRHMFRGIYMRQKTEPDNADNNASIECGKLNGTLTTVDFGTTSVSNILYVLFRQQDYHSGGAPHVCSEFWVIWYSYWGDTNPHIWGDNQPGQKHDLALYKSNIEAMFYQANASWSQYMIHGGTNFAWNAGATGQLAGITTSYDYAAAISEDGDTTDTYFALRDLISNISGWENKPLAVPPNNTKTNYGPVTLTRIGTNLVSTLTRIQETCVSSKDPLSFEQINHGYGFVLYTTTLKAGGNTLSTPNLRDHGFVYLNNVYLGWLLRDNTTTININAKPGDTLRILVENRGRNPAETPDSKGLNVQARLAWGLRGNGNVTLDGALLQDWFQCGINLTKASVDSLTTTFLEEELVEESVPEKAASQPGFYVGTFTANTLADTFFDSRAYALHGTSNLAYVMIGIYTKTTCLPEVF